MENARIRLITQGDDCGSNHSANRGIMEAYKTGILRNTSLMVTCPAVEEAMEMFAGEKGICVGIHLTLNAEWDNMRWGPVLPPEKVPSLVQADGTFFQTTQALKENGPVVEEVLAEMQAQLDKARKLGFTITYADMHMHFGWVIDGFDDIFDVWCRREGLLNIFKYVRRLPEIEAVGDPVERLIAKLEAVEPGQYLVLGHPAYDNEEMRNLGHDGYPGNVVAEEREWERRIFTDERMLAYCRDNSVVPIRYDEAVML